MTDSKGSSDKFRRIMTILIIAAALVYFIVSSPAMFLRIFVVIFGFGMVVMIHEFGHFIAAKMSDIKVEAFSIGFPPIGLGIRRTLKGWHIRILPDIWKKKVTDETTGEETEIAEMAFNVGKSKTESETEYRVGLIPFGGFVKMLGQEDVGSVEATTNPRSFANKSLLTKFWVIAAGVTFNALSAIVMFMLVFMIGVNLPPATIGGVFPGSPADKAGFSAGDEVIAIDGESKYLSFQDIMTAAALSDTNEPVDMTVRRPDGTQAQYSVVAADLGGPLRAFGIMQPVSLTVGPVEDPNELEQMIGLRPGDIVRSINKTDVENYWDFEQIVSDTFAPGITILAERDSTLISTHLDMIVSPLSVNKNSSELDLSHIGFMRPRLQVSNVAETEIKWWEQILANFNIRPLPEKPQLQNGDIIVSIADVNHPSYKEMRQLTRDFAGSEMPITVFRSDANGVTEKITVSVTPKFMKEANDAFIGITAQLDMGVSLKFGMEYPVVGGSVSGPNAPKLNIPAGASVTAVNSVPVANFYEIAEQLRLNEGKTVRIDWTSEGKSSSDVLDLAAYPNAVQADSDLAVLIPFKRVEKLYKADNPLTAVTMGANSTSKFILQTYATFKSLVTRTVSPKNLMGPIGIVSLSYQVVAEHEDPLVYMLYLFGLISASIAVLNFMPIPPLDGGLVIIMLIEKVKGSPLSPAAQNAVGLLGWVLLGSLIIYVTFNDIAKFF